MVDKEYREELAEMYGPDLVLFDDHAYDGAIIGVTDDYQHVVYSYNKMVKELVKDEGWTYEEAVEWIDYNTIRALPYGGDKRPVVVYDRSDEDLYDLDNEEEGGGEGPVSRKWLLMEFFKIMDNVGLLDETLSYDPEHFIDTVALPMLKLKMHEVKPTVICIVGPSGCGKSTLVEYVCKKHPEYGAVASYTTRAMRPGEVDGVGHRFVTEAEVPDKSEMVAYTYLNGCHYWATKEQMREKPVTLYVVDEAGVLFFREADKAGEFNLKTLYIDCTNSTVDKERRDRDRERVKIPMQDYDMVINNSFGDNSVDEFREFGMKAIEVLVSAK